MQNELMKPVSTYIKEIVRIQEELKDTILLGEFLDNLQVRVEEQGGVRFGSHRNPKTGKRACVLVNFGETPLETSVLAFDGNEKGDVRIYQPFEECKNAKLPVKVTVPPDRLVIVVEE